MLYIVHRWLQSVKKAKWCKEMFFQFFLSLFHFECFLFDSRPLFQCGNSMQNHTQNKTRTFFSSFTCIHSWNHNNLHWLNWLRFYFLFARFFRQLMLYMLNVVIDEHLCFQPFFLWFFSYFFTFCYFATRLPAAINTQHANKTEAIIALETANINDPSILWRSFTIFKNRLFLYICQSLLGNRFIWL